MPPALSRRALWALLLVFAIVWFGSLDYRKLVKPDEGRYAEIAREMAASGDWVTPRLNAIKYFEKPPLQYWATAAAYQAFGVSEWTARLWTALTGFLGVVLAWFAGRRLFGERAGQLGALVLGSSFWYAALGRVNTLDMGVAFFMELALAGFMLAHRDQASACQQKTWMIVVWAAMALAVLSKGLIGIVLPGAALLIYILLTRQWRILATLHWLTGLLVFFAISAPWFVLVSLRNPEFPYFFFIHEHFQRFLTTEHRRYEPWWYFIPLLMVGLLPWLTLLPQSLASAARQTATRFRPALLLLIWSVFVFAFFSKSNSKLPAYILPVFPSLALLIGIVLDRLPARRLALHMLPMMAFGGLLMLLALLGPGRFGGNDPAGQAMISAYARWILAAGSLALCGFTAAWWLARHERANAAITAAALSGFLMTSLLLNGHNAFARSSSSYYIARQIQPALADGVPFFSVGTYDQTMDFYTGRTMTLVDFADELEFGLKQEPQLALPSLDAFVQRWQALPRAVALLTPENYQKLRQRSDFSATLIARDDSRIIVKKP